VLSETRKLAPWLQITCWFLGRTILLSFHTYDHVEGGSFVRLIIFLAVSELTGFLSIVVLMNLDYCATYRILCGVLQLLSKAGSTSPHTGFPLGTITSLASPQFFRYGLGGDPLA
jgi:hypothetical protein